ncbi:hypothetical protein DFI02_1135 [Rhizobium sp. PP-F2F-G20b]|nr:hypothetical protein DFI02_1135 [Rhizobium sp. PP-F2F-G20b]
MASCCTRGCSSLPPLSCLLWRSLTFIPRGQRFSVGHFLLNGRSYSCLISYQRGIRPDKRPIIKQGVNRCSCYKDKFPRSLWRLIGRLSYDARMVQIIERNSGNQPGETSALSLSKASSGMFPRRRCRTTAPSPLSSARIRHQSILPALPIVRALTSQPPARPIPAKPMPPTGSIFLPGAAGPACLPSPRTRKPSASTSPPARRVRRRAA